MSGTDLAHAPDVSPAGRPPALRPVAPSGGPTYTLDPADRALIDHARSAFRTDFHYLLDVLWQARARQR